MAGPLLVLLALLSPTAGLGARVTPVEQVLNMLREMKTKGAAALETEKKVYAEYGEWVDDRTKNLGFDITTGKSEIEKLVAFIDKTDSDVANLGAAVRKFDGELDQMEGDKAAATQQRETDHAEFAEVQTDYADSVDALERAVQVLKQQNYNRPQAELLLQKMAAGHVKGMRRVLAAFLEESSAGKQDGAPAVAAYSFQSDGIVAVLEKLLDKFRKELSDVEEAESNQAHAYALETLHLGNLIEKATADREERAALKAKLAAESAAAKGRLADTRTGLSEDEKLLSETKSTFAAKTSQFEANQEVRAEELKAVGTAIDIIADPSVAASYAGHINLVQSRGVSLLQESQTSKRAIARKHAAELLGARAKALSSKVLAAAAAEVVANPFAKVIEMVEGLIAKLKEEAAAEADHKAYCDDELRKNKLKREKKTATVGRLSAEADQTTADIQALADEIKTLAEEQSALSSAMAEATTLRQKEKNTNEQAIADAQAAITAVKQALVVLREFYSSQAVSGAALLQKKQVPEMKAYGGMQGANGGVIGMMEVIESDFSRLETETKADEAQAAAAYATFMADSKRAKKQKHDREFKASLEKDQAEFELSETNKDLEATQEELDMANAYYSQLRPQCVEVKVDFAERVAKRKEEIAALKEAYKILDGM